MSAQRNDKYFCDWPECGKSYGKLAKLTEHKRSHTQERPFKCSECPKNFIRNSHLKRHVLISHRKEDPLAFACTHLGCSKRFSLAHQLARHVKLHMASKFKCTTCEATFVRKTQLRSHQIEIHNNDETLYKCDICSKGFVSKSKLERHRARFHSGRTYRCQFEGCEHPIFHKWTELLAHRRESHVGQTKTTSDTEGYAEPVVGLVRKVYKCETCEKEYSKKHALSVHINAVHLNIRPYKCRLCQSDFNYKHLLERHHQQVHLKEDNLHEEQDVDRLANDDEEHHSGDDQLGAIELCGLEYEMDRPIVCLEPTCRRRFYRQYDLERHVKSMHS